MAGRKRVCPNCGCKMKQQFIGLKHCKCGMSWSSKNGFFIRSPDMVFHVTDGPLCWEIADVFCH